MKFGIREVCDVTFTKMSGIGPTTFTVDTAKMSTLEGASTTVYAQGGKGNSRHMAWEGEKTLTFTLEDALITLDAFHALTGADKTTAADGKTIYTIKTTSFAGIYSVVATTLFRDESGNDHVATITIPKAKLQTNLNLSMAPTGDPASFTYTFDALADDADTLFTLTIDDDNVNAGSSVTTVVIDNKVYTTTTATNIELAVSGTGAVTLTGATISGTTLSETDSLSDFVTVLKRGDSIEIKQGSTSTWHII